MLCCCRRYFRLRMYSFVLNPFTSSTTWRPSSMYTKSATYRVVMTIGKATCSRRSRIAPPFSSSFSSPYRLASFAEANRIPSTMVGIAPNLCCLATAARVTDDRCFLRATAFPEFRFFFNYSAPIRGLINSTWIRRTTSTAPKNSDGSCSSRVSIVSG